MHLLQPTALLIFSSLCAPLSAQNVVLFDFDNAPLYSSLPVDVVAGGVSAHLSATGQGFSIQSTSSAPVVPAGFSGRFVYPNSVSQADLMVSYSRTVTAFSILYSPQELGCDDSARMRVTAYMNSTFVGTNTVTARFPGTWPTETLACAFPQGFNNVVIHYDAKPPACQDYGKIFLAENMRITLAEVASFTPFGTGCPGSGGVPTLDSNPGSLPWLGYQFTALLKNLGTNPGANLPFLFLGDSRTAWNTFTLPLDLTFLGMTNCTLYVNPLVAFGLVNANGSATWTVSIPNSPSVMGIPLFNQGGVTSTGTNPLGIVMSNACEMRIGLK